MDDLFGSLMKIDYSSIAGEASLFYLAMKQDPELSHLSEEDILSLLPRFYLYPQISSRKFGPYASQLFPFQINTMIARESGVRFPPVFYVIRQIVFLFYAVEFGFINSDRLNREGLYYLRKAVEKSDSVQDTIICVLPLDDTLLENKASELGVDLSVYKELLELHRSRLFGGADSFKEKELMAVSAIHALLLMSEFKSFSFTEYKKEKIRERNSSIALFVLMGILVIGVLASIIYSVFIR